MRFLSNLTALAAALLLTAASPPPAEQGSLAIVGADVLPMTGSVALRDRTVIVRGDRIVAIGPAGSTRIPPGATRVPGRGLTLLPGLVDMHVHLPPQSAATERALALMIAHGVTTARAMQSSAAHLESRAAIERGTLAGPRLYVAAPPLNDGTVHSPEEAQAAVRDARRLGFDLVKSHQISNLGVWAAVQDEARRQGLPSAGHVDNAIGLGRAMAAGEQVEHLDGAILDLLPPGSAERKVAFAQLAPPEVIAAATRAGAREMAALAKRVVDARSFQTPTLASFERMVSPRQIAGGQSNSAMRFATAKELAQWSEARAGIGAFLDPRSADAFLDLRRRIVRAYARAGVPLMAGSDTPHPFHLWGEGLLAEIVALASAGLTTMQALRAATVVPRTYFRSLPNRGSALGWAADFGTVETGARADLILVRGDPSRNVSALRRLDAVIAGGRLYRRQELDAMLDRLAAEAKSGERQP
jgi:imidazolonepropionase-like amidohydrolase